MPKDYEKRRARNPLIPSCINSAEQEQAKPYQPPQDRRDTGASFLARSVHRETFILVMAVYFLEL